VVQSLVRCQGRFENDLHIAFLFTSEISSEVDVFCDDMMKGINIRNILYYALLIILSTIIWLANHPEFRQIGELRDQKQDMKHLKSLRTIAELQQK
jgi:hypothetical protein